MGIRAWAVAAAAILAAGSVLAADAVEYKGRRIQAAAGGQAAECLALVRKAIDMTAQLPAAQRALAAEVTDLRCQPVPADRRGNEVADNTIGVYTMASPDAPGGYIRFPLKPGELSAADVAVSLVGNGQYARWHRAYLAARRQGDQPAAGRYHGILTHSDQKAVAAAECQLLDHRRAAIKALDLGERRLAAVNRQSTLRGCP